MRGEKGFTFIEVVIGLAVLGIVAVGFLAGLGGASKGLLIANERETANNLAEAQIEYIKQQAYDANNNPPLYQKLAAAQIPNGYDIMTPMAARLDPDGDGLDDDDNVQKLVVTVKHGNKTVLTVEDYKVR